MANPSVTYTFTNETVADATQVNQNFTDLINGLTDGSKSLNVDAITAAGTATLNGDSVIGNASGDASTVNATMSFVATPKVDTIAEKTAAAGVTIDGVLLKDNGITAAGNISFDGGTFVFNETGADKDFRIESDTNANMFFVDASANRVGIGTSTPANQFAIYVPTGGTSSGINSDALADNELVALNITGKRSGSSAREFNAGVFKHSGISETCAYFQLQAEDAGANYYWSDNSDQFRTSTAASNIGTTGGTIVGTQTSDERTKTDIKSIPYGLDTVMQLKPIEYDQYGSHKLGFGAQTTFKIVPEVVFDTKEPIDDSGFTKLGMEYVQIIPILVKAIQEQQKQIEELKLRLQ